MKITVLILLFVGLQFFGRSQQKVMVFFDEKPDQGSITANFSERALLRRHKQQIDWDFNDVPVNRDYIDRLNTKGQVQLTSRWLNGAVFETNLSPDEILESFPFVREVRGGGKSVIPETSVATSKTLDYGVGYNQANMINVDCLHDLGFTGDGIYLAVIDAGFYRMDSLNYLSAIYTENRIRDFYNFAHPGTSIYTASGHGTMVTSCIAGSKIAPYAFAGTGLDVDFAFYLTEEVLFEQEIEEFYLVAALERCDSVGVDVVNISLGYFGFDDSLTSHVYADMDGQTTIAAKGVNIAASKGIAVVASAGNSGPGYIGTPCDSDGALCVGAVDEFGNYASFSSVGPAPDGNVKPDIAAQGQASWVVNYYTDSLAQGNGTSFASPIACGGVACLRQAHPYASVNELFSAIRLSASQVNSPDGFLGYGIPDFCKAHEILTEFELNEPTLVFPNPADDQLIITLSSVSTKMQLFDIHGRLVWEENDGKYETIINTSDFPAGEYMLVIHHEQEYRKNILIVH